MTRIKHFCLNGEFYLTNDTITLFELLHYFGYKDSLLVLEYNNLICNKKDWKRITLKNDDKIEIVTIVGGG